MRARSSRTWVAVTAILFILCIVIFIPISLEGRLEGSAQSSEPITQQWVDQQLGPWKPTKNVSMGFGVMFPRASYDNILYSYNTLQVENASLKMLLSTKASCVRIDIGFDAWLKDNLSAQSEMSSLIAQIRSAGKCFIIADAAAESYRNFGKLPWTQFKEAWIQRVKTLASLYHPDYYIVIKEPGWYAPMVSDATTNPSFQDPNDWINLTETLVSTVKSVSPNTKVGVAIAADSLSSNPSLYTAFLTGVSKIPDLSFIGFDIYTASGFQNTLNFINQYGSGGKAVWIAECWSGDGTQIFDPSRSSLDASWMLLTYYFAQFIHATMVIPFYTDLFASYGLTSTSPTDPSQILAMFQQRTSVFYGYQNIVSTANATQSGNMSSTQTSGSSSGSPSETTTTSGVSSGSSNGLTSITSSGSSVGQARPLLLTAAGVLVIIVVVVVAFAFVRKRK